MKPAAKSEGRSNFTTIFLRTATFLVLLMFSLAALSQQSAPQEPTQFFEDGGSIPLEALAAQAIDSYSPAAEASAGPPALGPIAPAEGQPSGALSGRIVFAGARHGWVYDPSSWRLCRPVYAGINEDNGNMDQMTIFAFYCFNAGATVVPLRPIGHQTNEVVLDNDDPGVTWSGSWTVSDESVFYGSAGDVPFRFAELASAESATATYTPNIPLAGFYPVYTWVAAGSNRTNQLYRIRHTGGESAVRVPHHMVGNGWVYLGTYYFNAGSNAQTGAVVISNAGQATGGAVVIADAIRFGNGMGSIDRGSGVSTYPREEEATRYWVQNSLGQGQSDSIYDVAGSADETDDFAVTARMAREMNFTNVVPSIYKRIYIGFHSNATTGNTNTATARGTVGLYNNDSTIRTPNQVRLATLCGEEVTRDMTNMNAYLEVPWYDRGSGITYSGGNYGEINTSNFGGEMDATIIEVAFHDNTQDIKLLLDPKARNWIARAAYHAVIKYMNEFDGIPLSFVPEPPTNVRAVASSAGTRIYWGMPVGQAGSGSATGYLVYASTNGYGFGNPVGISGGASLSLLLNTPPDQDLYFRVAATNAGGQSFPSEVVGCRRSTNAAQSRVLFVNAFERFDRSQDLLQSLPRQGYTPPGNTGATGRVIPRANNAFDYVVQHGKAISAFGMPFDSCSRQAITNGLVNLSNYRIVIWGSGNSVTNTFRNPDRTAITNFQNAGGHLFVSGSDIAWDLDRASGPGSADRAFLNSVLHADLGADANNNSGSYSVSPSTGSIFANSADASFDDGTKGIYWVQAPDVLIPTGPGSVSALSYSGGTGGAAAVQYDGSNGGGKVVYFGFPFETITEPDARNSYMAHVLRFFSKPVRFESLAFSEQKRPVLVLSGEPGLSYTIQVSADLSDWTVLTNLYNPSGTFGFTDPSPVDGAPRFYRSVLVP